jgi:hypothetical protein
MLILTGKPIRVLLLALLLAGSTVLSVNTRADTASCNGVNVTIPFTDVGGSAFFCQIANAYLAGLTNGTSATAFSPGLVVTRDQMAAFTTRTLNQSLKRGSRRAALEMWWEPRSEGDLSVTNVGLDPDGVSADGLNLWVANTDGNTVSRVTAATGGVTGTWTGATAAFDTLVARGKVFVLGKDGVLFQIDPTLAPGAVSEVATDLGTECVGLAFDGSSIWGTCSGSGGNNNGNLFRVNLAPLSVAKFNGGDPAGILFDGTDLWVTDRIADTLTRRTLGGQTTDVPLTAANGPGFPAFDGINLWVPDLNDRMFVVRVKDSIGNSVTPTVIATLTGNGLLAPTAASFDGQRVLVTNSNASPNAALSLWRASDLAPHGFILTAAVPRFTCSDGINFWITFSDNTLRRF